MFKKADKQSIIVTSVIFVWIFAVNIVAPMLTTMHTWPMFFVTIFFFALGGDKKNIATIFLSGIVGILFAFGLILFAVAAGPVIGERLAVAIALFVILGLVIVGGNFFPMIFNNITFAYLTIATIDAEQAMSNTIPWILMLLIGGGVILAGSLISLNMTAKICEKYNNNKMGS